MLSNLLLEHLFSNAYAKPAVLISGLGWSIFSAIADAVDTSDVSTDSIRVMRSVPARRGIRKMRVIDGPSEQRLSSQVTVAKLRVTKSLEICCNMAIPFPPFHPCFNPCFDPCFILA